MSVEEQLAWEAKQKPRAAVAAALGGALTLLSGIYTVTAFRDVPQANFILALENATKPGPIGPTQSLRIPFYQYYLDHIGQFVLAAVLLALGVLGTGAALALLAYATRFRRAQFPRVAVYLPAVGAVLSALGGVLNAIGTKSTLDKLVDGSRTVDAVHGFGAGTIDLAGQLMSFVGHLALAAAFIMVCLNAMRAGLLTRFMGVLGILCGVLLILPLLQGPQVVQSFWLFALAALLAGYWRGGVPEAWRTGKEEPWPSGAELRAERMRAAGREPQPAAAAAGPARTATKPHSASKKRKRKRRG